MGAVAGLIYGINHPAEAYDIGSGEVAETSFTASGIYLISSTSNGRLCIYVAATAYICDYILLDTSVGGYSNDESATECIWVGRTETGANIQIKNNYSSATPRNVRIRRLFYR